MKFPIKKIKPFFDSNGFTLVELLVTISLMAVFVTFALGYNRTADQQLALFREEGKFVNEIYKARSLAITTFNRTGTSTDVPCGYGIHIASSTAVTLFKDLPDVPGNCKDYTQLSLGSIYSSQNGNEDVETISLNGIYISYSGSSDFSLNPIDILFVPPDPSVYSNKNFPINLQLTSPALSTSPIAVTINQFGQISTQ